VSKKLDYTKIGEEAYKVYRESQAYAGLSRNIKPEDAIKLFFPNVEESMMQVSSPLPKNRRDWITGWKAAAKEELKELKREE